MMFICVCRSSSGRLSGRTTTAGVTLKSKLHPTRSCRRKCRRVSCDFGAGHLCVTCVQRMMQQLRSTEALAETLEHENGQVQAARLRATRSGEVS